MRADYFIFGALAGSAFWFFFWPNSKVATSSPEIAGSERREISDAGILDSARSGMGDRLANYAALDRLSKAELRDELLVIEKTGGIGHPDEYAIAVLSAFARKDFEGAADWLTERHYQNRLWQEAGEVIGELWAATEPDDLIHYLNATQNREAPVDLKFPGQPDDFGLPLPPISVRNIMTCNKMAQWLISTRPREAFQIKMNLGFGYANAVGDLVEQLEKPADLAVALSAWKRVDPAFSGELRDSIRESIEGMHPNRNTFVTTMIAKWKKIDPEGFAQSEFVEWDGPVQFGEYRLEPEGGE